MSLASSRGNASRTHGIVRTLQDGRSWHPMAILCCGERWHCTFGHQRGSHVGHFIDPYLRCTGGVRRERIAKRYTIPTTASADLDHQFTINVGPITKTDGANLNCPGTDKRPAHFGGEATVSLGSGNVSSALATMAADVQWWSAID